MKTKRELRISGYKDYIAIDIVDETGKIIETPLYLRANGKPVKCKILWETTINYSSKQNWMEPGIIKFDGQKILASWTTGDDSNNWFEPTKNELTSPHIFQFK